MTIKDNIILWDNGKEKFSLLESPIDLQYKYVEGLPCITFGVLYENAYYKGIETFTLFDHFYTNTIIEIENTYNNMNGSFRIYDVGADTDGFVDFEMRNGKLNVMGQLGATFTSHSLRFEFEADQTLVAGLLHALTI